MQPPTYAVAESLQAIPGEATSEYNYYSAGRRDIVRKDIVRKDIVRKDVVRKDIVRKDIVRKDIGRKHSEQRHSKERHLEKDIPITTIDNCGTY